jgi:5'-deoxynucleotidase YfbR-like HD superfamily hydrolase
MSEIITQNIFEQKVSSERLANICLSITSIAMQAARVERSPRYEDGKRESDAEHSFHVALMAPELAVALELPLDPGLISLFANAHDLIEIETNDVATFLLDDDAIQEKEQLEKLALQRLLDKVPPFLRSIILRYEAQIEPAAVFVRHAEKLAPIAVDILGQGERVMHEDYRIDTLEQLQVAHANVRQRLEKKFGEECSIINDIYDRLAETFQEQYVW